MQHTHICTRSFSLYISKHHLAEGGTTYILLVNLLPPSLLTTTYSLSVDFFSLPPLSSPPTSIIPAAFLLSLCPYFLPFSLHFNNCLSLPCFHPFHPSNYPFIYPSIHSIIHSFFLTFFLSSSPYFFPSSSSLLFLHRYFHCRCIFFSLLHTLICIHHLLRQM